MARDLFHDLVRAGLEAEGWRVTDDPYVLKVDNFFQSRFAKSAILEYELRLVVYNSVEGGLVKWIV